MSFFGKIKSAVMRNPVIRDYEIGKQVASAGPGLMWKVHQAVKKSTRQVRMSVRERGWESSSEGGSLAACMSVGPPPQLMSENFHLHSLRALKPHIDVLQVCVYCKVILQVLIYEFGIELLCHIQQVGCSEL